MSNFDCIFRWWCHFDDDNYVNVVQLARKLQSFDPDQPLYLGKRSTAKPMEIYEPMAPQVKPSLYKTCRHF